MKQNCRTKNTRHSMNMVNMKEHMHRLATTNGIPYGHVFIGDSDKVLGNTLAFKVEGRRKVMGSKKAWTR